VSVTSKEGIPNREANHWEGTFLPGGGSASKRNMEKPYSAERRERELRTLSVWPQSSTR